MTFKTLHSDWSLRYMTMSQHRGWSPLRRGLSCLIARFAWVVSHGSTTVSVKPGQQRRSAPSALIQDGRAAWTEQS